jgi:CBS domain-containing protein
MPPTDTVEEHLQEQRKQHPAGSTTPGSRQRTRSGDVQQQHCTRRVKDVMTTEVVTVDRLTPYKQITRLMTEHRISGVPVLTLWCHVAGVVSEGDLIPREDKNPHPAGLLHPRRKEHLKGLIAGELMTAPAITIHPDATISGAARVMNARHGLCTS